MSNAKHLRLAICGASSTGKTTLSQAIQLKYAFLKPANVDARSLLRELGHQNVANMRPDEYDRFQSLYIRKKIEAEEHLDYFVTERSFVDVFSYWEKHCAASNSHSKHVSRLAECKQRALLYDLHIYLPLHLIPFIPDGYRHPSMEYHQDIDRRIRQLLDDWQLRVLVCASSTIESRMETVNAYIANLGRIT